MHSSRLIVAILIFAFPSLLSAADPPIDDEFFEKKVRPLLVQHCLQCHGPSKQKAGLRLDTRKSALAGGDNGPAIRPGEANSLVVRVVKYDGDVKMPPKGKLSAEEIATLTVWVKGGAPWPSDLAKGGGPGANAPFDLQARAKAHWSFQPVKEALPDIRGSAKQIRNPIDAFVHAKLEKAGLTFAPAAEKRVLVRRLYFDLIGLPPSPEEVHAFVHNESPDAYEKLVEKLLASPHYGERWGRHWLDLVRFSESYGHEFDYEIPNAWRYRDYVIRALNSDLPYERFLTEQIAGDLLPKPRRNPKDGSNEALLATGFWHFHEAKHSPVDARAEQADHTDNQIDVFGKTVLGLTLACARCHDHKFDPIATKDYYALFGVITSSRYQQAVIDDPAPTEKILAEIRTTHLDLEKFLAARGLVPEASAEPVISTARASSWQATAVPLERFDRTWRGRWDATGLGFRPQADPPSGSCFPHSGREAVMLPGALRSPTFTIDQRYLVARVAGRHAKAKVILNGLQLIQDPIYGGLSQRVNHGEKLRWIVFDLKMWRGQAGYLEFLDNGPGYVAVSEVWFSDTPPEVDSTETVPAPPTASLPSSLGKNPEAKQLADKLHELEEKIPEPHWAVAMRDGTGLNERVFVRGSPKNLGVEAPRALPEVFGKPAFHGPGSGRLELAHGLTDPANPLVARVLVNRLWKHHFGEGIVRSPDDFGLQGQRPTHPELLDWLAAELIRHKWSIKQVHRLMVNSTAYRQSIIASPEQAEKAVIADPQNKLLYRQNLHRLEAEAIRDSMLFVSGRLDETMEGPSIPPYLQNHEGGRGKPDSGPLDGKGRRSIYLQVRRNFLSPMFMAFDYPTPFTTIGRRSVSNVPAQALVMLNNPFVLQQAELWAKKVLAKPNQNPEQRVKEMIETAFGRPPLPSETASMLEFVRSQATEYGKADHPNAWADLAHVLFNAKEFIFVE